MKKQSKTGQYFYIIAILALVFIFSAFLLEKSQVTNFYSKPVSTQETASTRPVNDVRYTPADPTDNEDINQKKEDGSIDKPIQAAGPTGTPVNVVLTAAGQDEKGGPVIVKVLLTDVNTGTCNVELTKDTIVKNYSSNIINAGTYYTCDGFEIPLIDLSTGQWALKVTVTNADRSGTAEQTIQVSP